MSTDLYGVRILGLDGRTAKLRVFVVYYDVAYKQHQPLPDDPSFFCRLLGDWGPGKGAIQAEVPDNLRYEEAYIDSNAWRFVESVRRLEARNEEIGDWSAFSDFYYEREGAWQNEEKLVQADYEVVFTDRKWIAHWKKGASWGTASYPTQADVLTAAEAAVLPDFRVETKRIVPFDGPTESGTPEDAFFSDDGKLLAVTSQAGDVAVYETAGWKRTMRANRVTGLFPHAEFFPGTHVLGVRDMHGKTAAFEADSGTPGRAQLARGQVRSRSGTLRADFGEGPKVEILDEKGETVRVIETPHSTAEAASFSPDETTVATAGMDDQVVIWRIKDGARLRAFAGGVARVNHLAFSPDGRWLSVSGGNDGCVVDAESGAVRRRYHSRDTYPCEIAWSGKLVSVVHVGAAQGYGGWISIHEIGASWPAAKPEPVSPPAPPAAAPRPKKKAAAPKKAKPASKAKRATKSPSATSRKKTASGGR